MNLEAPYALLAELTHRCPLRCPYCSNPVDLVRRSQELDTATWKHVLKQAAEMGVLQVHFSGGEPTARPDIEELVDPMRNKSNDSPVPGLPMYKSASRTAKPIMETGLRDTPARSKKNSHWLKVLRQPVWR